MKRLKAPSLIILCTTIAMAAGLVPPSFAEEPVADSGRFHCDLGKFQKLPALLLIGENHCSKSSVKVKAEMAARGAKGEIFAAFEVAGLRAVYPWTSDFLFTDFKVARTEQSRLFGIESPFAHGISISYIYASGGGATCEQNSPSAAFSRFVLYLRNNPFLQRSWEEVRAVPPTPDDRSSGITELSDKIERARTAPGAEVQAIVESFHEDDVKDFQKILARVNARYVAMANETYLPDLGITKKLRPYPDVIWRDSMENILIPVRNRDMFDNIADIYCRAAEEGKNLAISMGSAHLPGVEGYLRQWSQDRIPLRTDLSYDDEKPYADPDVSSPIIKTLETLAAPSPNAVKTAPGLSKMLPSLESFDFSAAEAKR
ncbi:MAG: hypothetical protein WCU88_05235 [Elusimicrobiota bacterium]|jgi:hypothetical protein